MPEQDQYEELLALIREWAQYQIYPGREVLPTSADFSKWCRRGVELSNQLLRIGGVEPPMVEDEDA